MVRMVRSLADRTFQLRSSPPPAPRTSWTRAPAPPWRSPRSRGRSSRGRPSARPPRRCGRSARWGQTSAGCSRPPTLVERFDIEPFADFSAKWANFTGLVLFCIDAKFCKKIFVGKLLTRSTRFTCFCTAQTSIFQNFFVIFFRIFWQILQKFVIFEFFSLILAQILTKFYRNFADILENVEIFWNFEFSRENSYFDRIRMVQMVRMVRCLADRTFQLCCVPVVPQGAPWPRLTGLMGPIPEIVCGEYTRSVCVEGPEIIKKALQKAFVDELILPQHVQDKLELCYLAVSTRIDLINQRLAERIDFHLALHR